MTDFKLISLNVRGLHSLNKKKAILMRLTKQKADINKIIVFLQKTYSSFEDEKFGTLTGRAKCYFHTLTP